MIRLEKVSKRFFEGQPNEVRAVRDIDLTLHKDCITVFTGPSGSGKTTLLTLIGGLSKPSAGRIFLEDELTSNLPEKFLAQLRREHFGFVFQRFNLLRGLTVLENVMLPAFPLAPEYGELRARARTLLDKLDIGKRAQMKVDVLSGGEAQRVAIARALINDPEIIIADEPTANLDTKLSMQFLDIVKQLRGDGKTIIMTSHDPRIWQAELVDRVISMEDGRITDYGAGAKDKGKSATD
jgi:putative ABC transport system ATP-binding protein